MINDQRVLILAPLGRDGPVTADRLRKGGYAAAVCADAHDAARQVAGGAGALLLTEEALEQAGMSELFAHLQSQPPWSELPLVILTSGGEARLPRLLDRAAQAAGAITVLERPLGVATLLRTIEVALRSRRSQYQVRDLLDEKLRQNAAMEAARTAALNLADDDARARRQAEQTTAALRESEQRLALAASGTRIGIYDWNVASGEVAATEQAVRLLGLRTAAAAAAAAAATTTTLSQRYQYREWANRVHPEDLARVEAELQRCMQKRAPFESEYRVVWPDGTVRWIATRSIFEEAERVNGHSSSVIGQRGRVIGDSSLGKETNDQCPMTNDAAKPLRLLGVLMDITAAKESEAQIVRAKQEWERTFDSVSDMIFVTDENHRMVRVNRAMAERMGRPVEECVGLHCYAHIHGTKAPPKSCMHASAVSSGTTQTAEWHSKCLDGDFLVSASPLLATDGRVLGSVHVMRDITEQKRAEAREREALALASASQTAVDAFEATGEGVLVLDMEGRILSANPALERMTGIRERDAVGSAVRAIFSSIFSAPDAATAKDALAKALKGQRHDLRPLALSGKSGRRLTVIPSVSFVRGPKQRPKAVVVTLRDISKLMAVQNALGESERKYRELVENANSIIMRITSGHDITFFNEYAQTFFGYAANEILGKNVVGTIVPEVDSEGRNLREMTEEIAAHPEMHGANDNENTCKDGRRVWVHWSNRAIRDADGAVREILCVGTDITQRKRLEREAEAYRLRLRQLANRLAATEEGERRRVATQIHDTVIQTLSLGNIRLGRTRDALSAAGVSDQLGELDRVRTLLETGIEECRGLMADLTPPLLYEIGLGAALKDFAEKQATLHDRAIRIQEDGHPKPLDAGRRGLLFQCGRELVMNAIKYAGPCEILLSLSHVDEQVCLEVRDTGQGFDPRELDGQAKDTRQGGFGLFNIRERLQGLGGRLEIESAAGKGTTATVLVPVGTGR
jgi:PAS domain S-box-containing protein